MVNVNEETRCQVACETNCNACTSSTNCTQCKGSKYLYKSSKETDRSFFDDIDEAILKGNLSNTEENEELGAKSEIVEKFIKVVEILNFRRQGSSHWSVPAVYDAPYLI